MPASPKPARTSGEGGGHDTRHAVLAHGDIAQDM